MELTEVYQKISNLDIKVFSYNIPETKAATIEVKKKYGIFLNYKEINSSHEEFMVLTHEYGHCKSGATHKLNSKYDIIERHEYRANKQAILTFLPFCKLKKVIAEGITETYAIAEKLDLPEQFVIMAINHYKHMGKL